MNPANTSFRVLEVTKSTAGVAEYVRGLARELDKSRFSLTVACLSEGSQEFAAELAQIPGVSAFSLAMNRYQIDPFSDSRVLLRLRSIIRNERFDLIHAHASKPGFLARLAAAGSQTPVIYSPHCFSFHAGTGSLKATLLADLERFAAHRLTTCILTVADGERTLARQYNVGSDEQFFTIHTGIDPAPFERPLERGAARSSLDVPGHALLVGSVGRLSAQKAPLDFVRAAGHVHKRQPGVHFAWIGSGPLEPAARQLAAQLGLGEVMHFVGQRSDVPRLMGALDCFVLTSLWEGFPIVLLEAMAAGAPIVASDIPGNDEAIAHGKNGWLVKTGDAAATGDAILDLLQNPERAGQFRQAGRKRIQEEFTRANMMKAITCLYEETALRLRV